MKIIELYEMIASNMAIPKKIKYRNELWYINIPLSNYYRECSSEPLLCANIIDKLNDEVEIIEDVPKKIEKLDLITENGGEDIFCYEDNDGFEFTTKINAKDKAIIDKINEIIDKIKEMEE